MNKSYEVKARAAAIDAIRASVGDDWTDEQVAAAADIFISRGFGRPGLGETGRTSANVLRKVRPATVFAVAKEVAGNINRATVELTGSDAFDKMPWLCTHCGDRFATNVSPRTHYSAHSTVFDPRTF